jgi:hypothetical protein
MTGKEQTEKKKDILIAMIMCKQKEAINTAIFIKDLKENGGYTVVEDSIEESRNIVLDINGEMVVIMNMPSPVPRGDIEATSKYAYNWMMAGDDLRDHQGHIIVTMPQGGSDAVTRFSILTATICSILRAQDAIGVYIGEQSLLIPKKHYLTEAKKRTATGQLPLNLWIYFGLRTINKKNYGYTYGLTAFGKKEMEITASGKGLVEIRAFLYNMAYYVIENNVEFEDGQSCGMSEDEVINITLAKGEFNDGEVLRLGY